MTPPRREQPNEAARSERDAGSVRRTSSPLRRGRAARFPPRRSRPPNHPREIGAKKGPRSPAGLCCFRAARQRACSLRTRSRTCAHTRRAHALPRSAHARARALHARRADLGRDAERDEEERAAERRGRAVERNPREPARLHLRRERERERLSRPGARGTGRNPPVEEMVEEIIRPYNQQKTIYTVIQRGVGGGAVVVPRSTAAVERHLLR